MAKVESRFIVCPSDIPEALAYTRQQFMDAVGALEFHGFMLHEVRPAIEEDGTEIRWSTPDGQGGPCEQYEYRKTIDYSREERRAARRSGQVLKPNEFKSVLPAGWQVIQPDDPRLALPPSAEGDAPCPL